jgi:hypothetical protein
LVENRFHDEHFLLSNTQQVVVVCRALDDATGRSIEVGRFIDNYRRVAWTGDNRSLAAIQRSPRDGWAASNAN